jgi:hypothetical protein
MNCAANLARPAKLVITFSGRTNPAIAFGMKLRQRPPLAGPRNLPHGMWTDSSETRWRSAASLALSFFPVTSQLSGNASVGNPPLAHHTCVPALPLRHRAVDARLPGRRARYPNYRPLMSRHQIR